MADLGPAFALVGVFVVAALVLRTMELRGRVHDVRDNVIVLDRPFP
jgi:hypothetical protein